MGNGQSQFEEQFYQLYKFVGLVEDRVFSEVKIYRKLKFNFDYMMVFERPLSEFVSEDKKVLPAEHLSSKLQMIRKYQNSFTARLSYSIILEAKGLACSSTRVRLFLQYYNHSLSDYLSALRSSKLMLTVEELKFVCQSLVEGILVLRKMEITQFWLTLDKVWVSCDQGNVVLNPVQLIYQDAHISLRSRQINQLSKEYQPIDLSVSRSCSHNQSHQTATLLNPLQSNQIQNILQLYIEMTRYIEPKMLMQVNRLYRQLQQCRVMTDMYQLLQTGCQELNVQQFGQIKQPQSLYAKRIDYD